jgi:PAS domain-containing protein
MGTLAPSIVSRPKATRLRQDLGGQVDLYFERLGRDGFEEIQSAARLALSVPLLQEVINAMPVPVSLLNEKGQVILTNRWWDRLVGDATDCILGKRHGELLGCIHCHDGPGGCSTLPGCAHCGAASAIFESQELKEQVTREYRLRRQAKDGEEVAELLVTATPLKVDHRNFTVFALQEGEPGVSRGADDR